MKKSKLLILSLIIPCAATLSGCFFTDMFRNIDNEDMGSLIIDVAGEMKLNLSGVNSKELKPVIHNTSVKNPTFTFTSANPGIASVDQNGLVTAVAVGETEILIELNGHNGVATNCRVKVVDEAVKYDYTIMYYMCGSDLEGEDGLFTQDIQEILSATGLPDSVRILIETGGSTRWHMPSTYLEDASSISTGSLQRWEVNNKTHKLKHIATLNTNCMAEESSFRDFLKWGLNDYSASQMGVVISGHGGGIAGCAYDDNHTYRYGGETYQHTLQTHEVVGAVESALTDSIKDKFTWIGYDCCLMQCADIASMNADYFDYMVASQESEAGTGWNHDVYLAKLAADSNVAPETFLPTIADSFVKENHDESESGRDICYQTLSVLDLTKMQTLTDKFNAYCANLSANSSTYSKAGLAFKASYNAFGKKMYGLCDFSSLLTKLDSQFTDLSTSEVRSAINDVVIANSYCSKYSTKPCGMNAFFPESLDRTYGLQPGREDYNNEKSTKFKQWQNICVSFGSFEW